MVACSLCAAPAYAQRGRVFVASYGNDSNPCTFGSPCRNFQQAVNVVLAGGEVTAIDSAGFGPIDISKAVTITSPDGVEAGIVPAAGGNAITIHAGASDAIVLRGLTLNGSGIAINGVEFNSGGSLTVINCVAQNFIISGPATGNGILLQPTTGTVDFTITNTIVLNNAYAGILYLAPSGSASVNGVIDRVTATGNQYGIALNTSSATGATIAAISNSVASHNTNTGIYGQNGSGAFKLSIDNSQLSSDGSAAIQAFNTANVLLGRSVIMGNAVGVHNTTSPNTFFTYKDNRINLNTTDIDASPLLTQAQQ
jgi:hypothetical protein